MRCLFGHGWLAADRINHNRVGSLGQEVLARHGLNLLGCHALNAGDVLIVEQRVACGNEAVGQRVTLLLNGLLLEDVLRSLLAFDFLQFFLADQLRFQPFDLFINRFAAGLRVGGLTLHGNVEPAVDDSGRVGRTAHRKCQRLLDLQSIPQT